MIGIVNAITVAIALVSPSVRITEWMIMLFIVNLSIIVLMLIGISWAMTH